MQFLTDYDVCGKFGVLEFISDSIEASSCNSASHVIAPPKVPVPYVFKCTIIRRITGLLLLSVLHVTKATTSQRYLS
jgi:hypothetical protein